MNNLIPKQVYVCVDKSMGWIPRRGLLGRRVNAFLILVRTVGSATQDCAVCTVASDIWRRLFLPGLTHTVGCQTFEFFPTDERFM